MTLITLATAALAQAANPSTGASSPGLGTVAGTLLLLGGVLLVVWGLLRLGRARREGAALLTAATAEAQARAKTIELEAERRAAERRAELDAKVSKALAEIDDTQARVARREEALDRKLDQLGQREQRLDERDAALKDGERRQADTRASLERDHANLRDRLATVAGLTAEQAREQLLAEVRVSAERDAALLSQKVIQQAEAGAREQAREILLMSIQRYAGECASDGTVRSVKIPSEDLKGRVIGREGRNIRHFEKVTGVDVLIDDTPGVIAVSCFDRVRQAIAAEALQKLVNDGRIHPTRIEEVVEQVRRDIQDRIVKAGQDAAMEADVRGLHPKVIEMMGRLHFRTSYGQNVLRHSVEVAFLCQLIAGQLGLDTATARRAGFLHDIGKAMDHEVEGGHPAIGMDFARRHGETSEAVLNAIGGHHGDIPCTTPFTPIVTSADAVSGARPGARRESMEHYVKRLEQLESIAMQQPGVQEAYAIQAGREVRVIVDASKADDARCFAIASEVARRVEAEMTFPGEIKVTVLREMRAEASAR
jgi:ribonuclease Y